MANLLSTSINGTLKVDSAAGSNRGFTFKENGGTEWALIPLASSTLDLGSQASPFRNVYANNFKLTSNTGATNLGNTDTSTFMQVSDDKTEKTSKIILGNETATSDAAGRTGQILLYGAGKGGTILKTKQTGSTTNEISFPSKDGTVCLEKHSHAFKTTEFDWFVTGKDRKYATKAGADSSGILFQVEKDGNNYKPNKKKKDSEITYGKVVLKNCYGWGSDFLDIFVIRGCATFRTTKAVEPNIRLRLGCIKAKSTNYLPGGTVPLSIYRYSPIDIKGLMTHSLESGDGYTDESYIDIRCTNGLAKDKTYTVYFTATYGRIGSSVAESEIEDDNEDIDTVPDVKENEADHT